MNQLILHDGLICTDKRLSQKRLGFLFTVVAEIEVMTDSILGNATGILSSGMAAHAVGDNEEASGFVDVISVLVDSSDKTFIGLAGKGWFHT